MKFPALLAVSICWLMAFAIIYAVEPPKWLLTIWVGYAFASAFSDLLKFLAR